MNFVLTEGNLKPLGGFVSILERLDNRRAVASLEFFQEALKFICLN